MNRKKRVIFYVSSDVQYSSEFNENIKIKMLKSYLKDVSHIDKFRLLTNKNTTLSDEQSLKDLNISAKEVFFRVIKEEKNTLGETQLEELLNENTNLKRKNEELIEIIKNYESENEHLKKSLEEYSQKCVSYQKSLDSISYQNIGLINTINNLKNEIIEYKFAENNIDKPNDSQRTQMINSSNNKMRERESFQSRNQSILDKRESFNLTDTLSKIGLNTERKCSRKKSSTDVCNTRENGSLSGRVLSTEAKTKRTLSCDLKIGARNHINNEGISKKNGDYKYDKIFRFFKIDSVKNNFWKLIFEYLKPEDLINFSVSSKNNHSIFNMYFKEFVSFKLRTVTAQVNLRKSQILNYKFSYSPSTNSTIRILNKSNYSEIFKSNEKFSDEVLIIYRLLFQITHICDDNHQISDDEFNLKIKAYFKESSNIGDLIKSLYHDFSGENIDKLRYLMEKYKINSINCTQIGKAEKTSGMISMMVKECLIYCGLLNSEYEKVMQSSSSKERLATFKDLNARKSCMLISRTVLEKLENLGEKYKADNKLLV